MSDLTNKTPKEIKEYVEANYDLKEQAVVKIEYSRDEIRDMKAEALDSSTKLVELKRAKAKVTKKFNAQIKMIEPQASDLLLEIKKGYREEEQEVFGVKDFAKDIVEFYTSEGVLQYSRPLRQSERQMSISHAAGQ